MRRSSQRARNIPVSLTQSTPGLIARIRDCRIRILVAGGKCIYRGVPSHDGGLGWPSTGIDSRYVRCRQSLKSCDHRRLKIGPGHFVLRGHREDAIHKAPFIGALLSPRFTISAKERGAISRQASPPQPRLHSVSFKKEACFPTEIQTVAPWSSGWRVGARDIWLASQTVSSCACLVPIQSLPPTCICHPN
jgi:hypothetical protein